MKNILFATDFSEDASTAFEFAILLAQKVAGELVIVHTYMPPYVDPATPITLVDTMQKETIESYQKKLDEMVNTVNEIGVPVRAELKISTVVSGIETCIEENDIDCLVVGKTGYTGFLSKMIGSNTSDIINEVKIPTFVIPKLEEAFISIEQFLYGTQLEFDEIKQLSATLKLAKSLNADVSLVHVKAPNEMDIRNNDTLIKDINTTFANEAPTIEIIEAQSVTKGLHSAINLFQADILVVSTHSRSFLTQLFNPSKSQSLADSVNIPVLVLHFD